MANYAKEKANYGGVVGTIQIFTSQLPAANNPADSTFKTKVPAGFLKCNGAIKKASEFPALAAIIGTGNNCKFKKPNQELEADQIQLPDLGSKVIVAGQGIGTYINDITEDSINSVTPVKKVGSSVELTSNVGTSLTLTYSGNFNVLGVNPTLLLRNPRVNFPSGRKVSDFVLDESNFQAHGHDGNQRVLNFTSKAQVISEEGAQPGGGTVRFGNVFAGNAIAEVAANTLSRSHTHNFAAPTSYPHDFKFSCASFNVSAENLATTLNISVKNVTKLDEAVSPFILVEYIIKY